MAVATAPGANNKEPCKSKVKCCVLRIDGTLHSGWLLPQDPSSVSTIMVKTPGDDDDDENMRLMLLLLLLLLLFDSAVVVGGGGGGTKVIVTVSRSKAASKATTKPSSGFVINKCIQFSQEA